MSHYINMKNYLYFCRPFYKGLFLSDGVIGNTSDFGSEESRFEPWSDNSAFVQG